MHNDGACPECGTAVGRSTHGYLLRFCDPGWVCTLASGMNWIVAGIALLIGAGVVMVAAGYEPPPWLFVTTGLICVAGYWKVTTRDPAGADEPPAVDAEALVRICMPSAVAFQVVQPLLARESQAAGAVAGVIGVVVGLIGTVALFVCAERLARRVPDDQLASHTRIVMRGALGSLSE